MIPIPIFSRGWDGMAPKGLVPFFDRTGGGFRLPLLYSNDLSIIYTCLVSGSRNSHEHDDSNDDPSLTQPMIAELSGLAHSATLASHICKTMVESTKLLPTFSCLK